MMTLVPLAAIMLLGVPDRGIFPDLDPHVTLEPPAAGGAATAVLDEAHSLLVVYLDGAPRKAYPVAAAATPPMVTLTLAGRPVPLRAGDAAELAPLLPTLAARLLGSGEPIPGGDRDGDGLPDALDIAIGAKKVALNGAKYVETYESIPFPAGDVARDHGVCTDVIVRSLRNAGIDLQAELYADIAAAPRAYPMVKKRNPNIDQRRVRTILPWFVRHFSVLDPHVGGPDAFLPGDVVFFDTFPRREGPDHLGIVSDRIGPSGLPLVVNNWTEGYHEAEMDLLGLVPVTHHFRVK